MFFRAEHTMGSIHQSCDWLLKQLMQVNIPCKGHWQGQKLMSLDDNLNSTTAHETIAVFTYY